MSTVMIANMLTLYRFILLSNTELGENSAQNILRRCFFQQFRRGYPS